MLWIIGHGIKIVDYVEKWVYAKVLYKIDNP